MTNTEVILSNIITLTSLIKEQLEDTMITDTITAEALKKIETMLDDITENANMIILDPVNTIALHDEQMPSPQKVFH